MSTLISDMGGVQRATGSEIDNLAEAAWRRTLWSRFAAENLACVSEERLPMGEAKAEAGVLQAIILRRGRERTGAWVGAGGCR
jgi:hypothetical protein